MRYDDFQALRVSVEHGVATVTIDHGEINLFDITLIGEMARVWAAVEADQDVRAVVLQSANPHFFIAHADLTLIQTLPAEVPPRAEKLGMFHAMCERFRTMAKATIVKLEGVCRGGGSEFALACDMRFAAIGKAVLGQPEVALGLIPGGGGCVRLPRLVGRARALEIVLGCGDLDAVTAERYGYVNRALPAAEIGPFVDNLARRIASYPPEVVRLAKDAVLKADRHVEDDLVHEERNFFTTLKLDDTRRRMAAGLAQGLQTPSVERGSIAGLLAKLAN
jgi:enoyl-CoA hydratase/carnithine racemase